MEDDPEFEVTAEMLVHQDLDDETTLEEEEASTQPGDVKEELEGLEQESEMPLEQLLALYGYRGDLPVEEEEGLCASRNPPLDPAEVEGQCVTEQSSGRDGSPPKSPPEHQMQNGSLEDIAQPRDQVPDQSAVERTSPLCNPATGDAGTPRPPSQMEGSDRPADPEVRSSAEPTVPPCCGPENLRGVAVCSQQELIDKEKLADPVPDTVKTEPQLGNTPPEVTSSGSLTPVSSSSQPHRKGRARREEGKYRLRPELPERRSIRLMQNEAAAVEAYFASVLEGSDDDDNSPPEDWKREVKIGPDHQVDVPVQPTHLSYSYDTLYDDKVIWKPDGIDESEVSRYLAAVAEQITGHPPPTTNPHDDERALEILQRFHHDTQHALKWIRTKGLPGGTLPWTEEECKKFEAGLKAVGKDFNALSKQFNTRTLKELVEFYYVWKKTEGFSLSAQQGKLTRKKVTLQQSACTSTDFMERLLDLQDRGADSDILYATSSVAMEAKKDN